MHYIGILDRNIYKCITQRFVTDEVIITDNQILHIKKRHPADFESYSVFLPQIVEHPDYIIETNRPNTALILKKINHIPFKTVMRIIIPEDLPTYKNSIITFMKIDEKEWSRLLKNKIILYRRE